MVNAMKKLEIESEQRLCVLEDKYSEINDLYTKAKQQIAEMRV